MASKLERFTQRARKVLTLAQEEAERMNHNYIGTEHLLLGLMKEEGGVAAQVLAPAERPAAARERPDPAHHRAGPPHPAKQD